ncbi:Eag protein [Salmonella enterica subsp. enterica serovar Saintpaul]|nr:Eag protein [Salmonella enterica subsp. enterica serovar Saintpaul]
MKYCPECGSNDVVKDKQRGGWNGDYICENCGFNADPGEFWSETEYRMRKRAENLPGYCKKE